MKIGILTFHRALNYGAVLQCYALQEMLSKMGHKVSVIDYRPPYLEQYRSAYSWYALKRRIGIEGKIKEIIVRTLLIGKRNRAIKAFDVFVNGFLYIQRCSINNMGKLFDAIVIGSDQVWSPSIGNGFDDIYWGCFTHKGTKVITYAASIGGHNQIDNNKWTYILRNLSNYNAISVREDSLLIQLREKTNEEIIKVIDPVLLHDANFYNKILIEPKIDNYLLFFILVKDLEALSFARRIAKEKKLRIIAIQAFQEFNKDEDDVTTLYSKSPLEFLGLIKNADTIVTNSFHGTAFSIIFKKDFYCLKGEQEDRSRSLLDSLDIGERLVSAKDIETIKSSKKINYDFVHERLSSLREQSIEFIHKSLS